MGRRIRTKKIHRVRRTLLLIGISMLIGGNVYLWNAKTLVGNAMPMPFGYGASVVMSGSMEPELAVDDLVILRKTQDVKVGDVIVYQSGYELIIHRVISVDGGTVRTQGDANNAADPPVSRADVKGKMIAHIPFMGKIVRIFKQPAVVLAVLAAAFLLMEMSYRREREKDDRDLEQIKEEIRRLRKEQAEEEKNK